MGLEFDNIELFKTYKYENAFKDVYIIKSDVNTENLVLQSDEVELAKFLTVEEINELIKNSMVRTTNLDAFNDLVNNIYKMN